VRTIVRRHLVSDEARWNKSTTGDRRPRVLTGHSTAPRTWGIREDSKSFGDDRKPETRKGLTMATTDNRRFLLVLTSHDKLGDTGRRTGYTVSEAADPWQVLTAAGWEVDIATIAGGRPPEDGTDTSGSREWREDDTVQAKLDGAPSVTDVDPARYQAVFFVGGHGTMWDFPGNADLTRIASGVYEDGGVVAAVCHGPAALTTITLSDGSLLVDGKNIAAFTDAEEKAISMDSVVPFLLQSRLEQLGARHTGAGLWEEHVVTDGRLVTGQNPASAAGVARAALSVLA
jgi:putative intracellular protease/amidase